MTAHTMTPTGGLPPTTPTAAVTGTFPASGIDEPPGWFHRTGSGPGSLKWTPAETTEGTGSSPPPQHHPVTTTPPNGRFPVGQVNGDTPTDLAAFLGVATFTVIRGELTYRVFGTGHATYGAVSFPPTRPELGWPLHPHLDHYHHTRRHPRATRPHLGLRVTSSHTSAC